MAFLLLHNYTDFILNNIHKCYILSESNDLQLIKWRFYE